MRTPGRTRPSYCRAHAYRAPAPMPTASRTPRANAAPKRRASDRRRRGRAVGSPSVTAATTGSVGTASTPGSRIGDVSACAMSIGSPGADASAIVTSAGEGSALARGAPRWTRAASSGSPTGGSPSGGEALAAGSASGLGRSVISNSCALNWLRAWGLAAATFSRLHANLSRRCSARSAGTETRAAPQALRAAPGPQILRGARDLRAPTSPLRGAWSPWRDPSWSRTRSAPPPPARRRLAAAYATAGCR